MHSRGAKERGEIEGVRGGEGDTVDRKRDMVSSDEISSSSTLAFANCLSPHSSVRERLNGTKRSPPIYSKEHCSQ